MKVNLSIQNSKYNKISFTGDRLYSLKLLQQSTTRKNQFIPAFFTQITHDDIPLLKKIQPLWENTEWGNQILTGIFNKIDEPWSKNKFYMIECPQFSDLNERIRALCSTYLHNNLFSTLELQVLQSASRIQSLQQIKGAGTAIVRGLSKIIKNNDGITKLNVVSTPSASDFYSNLNFYKNTDYPRYNSFSLRKCDVDVVLEETKCVYGDILEVKN